jgi:hypothetical protein
MAFEVPRERMREVVNEVKPKALRERPLKVGGRFGGLCRALGKKPWLVLDARGGIDL